MWRHKSPGSTSPCKGLHVLFKVRLNDACRHPSFPYLIPQKVVAASPLPPQWVLLYHLLGFPFSRNQVLPTARWSSCCWEWGRDSWYILKWSLSDSYYQVSHIQLLSLRCSLLHEFLFTFLNVYCTSNSYVATIHRRTMGTGRQWMTGMQKEFLVLFFFPLLLLLLLLENNLGKPSDEKKIYSSASSCPVPVSLFKALWEAIWGKVASKQHTELHLFPPYPTKKTPKPKQKTQKMLSSLFYSDLTWVKHLSPWHKGALQESIIRYRS